MRAQFAKFRGLSGPFAVFAASLGALSVQACAGSVSRDSSSSENGGVAGGSESAGAGGSHAGSGSIVVGGGASGVGIGGQAPGGSSSGGASAGRGGAGAEAGGAEAGAPDLAPTPSCAGLSASCGITASDDCCARPTVPAGHFTFGGASGSRAATIASFALDKYEVTVGRFRNFVSAYAGHPANGAGAHPSIPNSGWQSPAWDGSIAADGTALAQNVQCQAKYHTWSTTGHDTLPMNCVSWFEAFAFCAWDGGRLPTEAEWEYAADGGSDERAYPWGNTPIPDDMPDTAAYANYDCLDDPMCSFAIIEPVGSKPAGAGKFGHLDLAGSMWEWALDWDAPLPNTPCDNCANLTPSNSRTARGGSWTSDASLLGAANRYESPPSNHVLDFGFRCARTP
jgi:sulfatase modifying factor 1